MKRLLFSLLFVAFSAFATTPYTVTLLSNTAVTGPVFQWPGGVGTFTVVGTFSGATVTLEYLGPDLVTYVAAGTATTCTAACTGVAYLGAGPVKAVVSGGPPSAMYASLSMVQN